MESSIYKELAIKTYNKIFVENLHIPAKDFEKIKSLVIRNQTLLTDKSQKLLFLLELTDLIKANKIDVAQKQIEKYGTVIMANYDWIRKLYDWVEEQSEIDTNKKEPKRLWLSEQSLLTVLVDFLAQEKLISSTQKDQFINLFLENDGDRINWLGSTTLLIYLIEQLKQQGIVDRNVSNIFIEHNFCTNGKMIDNIKQAKSNMKTSKSKKPHQSGIIDTFINALKNTLPMQ